MPINIVIFLKLLSDCYPLKTGPRFSDTFLVQGLRHYSPHSSYKGYLVIIRQNPWSPGPITDALTAQKNDVLPEKNEILSENVLITCCEQLFHDLSPYVPMIYVQNVSFQSGLFENILYDLWERLQAWLQSLNEISLTCKNYQTLIDACDNFIAEPVALINHHFCYVAYSKKLSEKRGYIEKFVNTSNTVSIDITTQLIVNPEYKQLISKQGVFEFMDDYHFIACNIFSENIAVGRLISICTEKPDIDNYQKQIIALLAPYIEKMYSRNGTFFLEEPTLTKLHQLLLKSLENANVSKQDWVPLASGLDWSTDDIYQIVCIRPTFRYEKNLYPNYLCPQIEQRWPFSAAVVFNNNLVVLINQSHASPDYTQELAYFLRDNLMCAGASRSFDDLAKIPDAFSQSSQALTLGLSKNPHFWFHSFDSYAFDYLLSRAQAGYEAKQICHPALLKLLAHDKHCGSQYYETLYAWFKNRFNSVAAAKELFIHRTTFIKRMEHIREITGADFDDWDTLVYLALSFRLFDLEAQAQQTP